MKSSTKAQIMYLTEQLNDISQNLLALINSEQSSIIKTLDQSERSSLIQTVDEINSTRDSLKALL